MQVYVFAKFNSIPQNVAALWLISVKVTRISNVNNVEQPKI